jgi:hypothetical protein
MGMHTVGTDRGAETQHMVSSGDSTQTSVQSWQGAPEVR